MTDTSRRIPDLQAEPMSPAIVITALILVTFILGMVANKFIVQDSASQLSPEQRLQIKSGLNFPPLAIDQARLEQARRQFYEIPDLQEQADTVKTLLEMTKKANLSQFPPQDGESFPPLAELDHHLRLLADELLPAAGARGFSAVGAPIFKECMIGLNDLLTALHAQELPLAQALEDPPHQRFATYRENCGNVFPVLIERHLVTSDGRWTHEYGEEIFNIMQRYRWADLIHSRYPTSNQISPYELELFARWRIEDPNAFTAAERRQLLAQSRAYLPSTYDLALATARIEAANQDLGAAALRLANLVDENPENPIYSAIFDALERQMALGLSE